MRKYETEINDIWRIFRDEGVILPDNLSTSMYINARLDDLLDDLTDTYYAQGRYDCPCDGEDY